MSEDPSNFTFGQFIAAEKGKKKVTQERRREIAYPCIASLVLQSSQFFRYSPEVMCTVSSKTVQCISTRIREVYRTFV